MFEDDMRATASEELNKYNISPWKHQSWYSKDLQPCEYLVIS